MMRLFKFGRSASTVAVAAGALMATGAPAMAQAPGASPVAEDEIIVNATRRSESLQDVPVAVTAITAEAIEELAPRTLQDLSGAAPNLFIGMNTAGPGASAIFIRGLGYADIEKTQNPAAGVIIDGVFLGTSTGQLVDTFDLQQVEVTRGPAGIFFGKNTTAGVISLQRSLPTREMGFRGSASYGTENAQVYRAVANLPLGEQGGLKIGGTYRDRDGYYDNVFTRRDNGFVEYSGFNAALDLDVTPWLNVLGIVDVIKQEGGGTPVQYGNKLTANILSGGNPGALFGPTYNAQTGSPTGLKVLQVQNNFGDADELDMKLYNLTVTIDTPFGDLVSTTAYLDSADIVFQDFDGTCSGAAGCPNGGNFLLTNAGNPTGTLHTIRDQDYKQLTEEVRLSGSVGAIDYLVGAYYFDSELDFSQRTNGAVLQLSGEEAESYSFFGNLDWRVTPRLTLSAGVRNIDEEKSFRTRIDIPAVPLSLVAPITQSDSWNDTITRVAAEWKYNDASLVYVSRSEGFRSGGFSIRGTLSEQIEGQTNCGVTDGDAIPFERLCPNNNFLTYDPEVVTAYELGVKNSWIDDRLVFNAAIFKTEVEDFQQSTVVTTGAFGPGTNTYINNLPEVEIEGLEFELVIKPTFLWTGFEGLTLSSNLGLQDGQVVSGSFNGQRTAGFPNGNAGAPGSTATVSGRLLRVPDYNVGYRASWEFPVAAGTLTFGAGYNYIDDHTLANFGTTGDVQEGYSLVDASIDFETEKYRISLTGKNLADEEYRVHSLPTVFFQGWGDPVTWALEVQAKF